jgi:predicted transcriptional regulator
MGAEKTNGRRRSVLELAPLELACMNALWRLGEATVREIRDRLAPHRPRAYTTIMTIMDRLAQKGVVSRKKVSRAYRYVPNLTMEQAQARAVAQVVEGFFGGSTEALRAHLGMAAPPLNASAGEAPSEAPLEESTASIDETLL